MSSFCASKLTPIFPVHDMSLQCKSWAKLLVVCSSKVMCNCIGETKYKLTVTFAFCSLGLMKLWPPKIVRYGTKVNKRGSWYFSQIFSSTKTENLFFSSATNKTFYGCDSQQGENLLFLQSNKFPINFQKMFFSFFPEKCGNQTTGGNGFQQFGFVSVETVRFILK